MSRKPPSAEEVLAAISKALVGRSTSRFEDIRYKVQLQLKTVPQSARDWMRAALTDPAQDELVMLFSDDNKRVHRVKRNPSGTLSYYGELREGESYLSLYLDNSGCRVKTTEDAVRNVIWVMPKSILDIHVTELLKEQAEKQAERDKEQAVEDAKTEEIIGAELSMIRGMLAAAGITATQRTVRAWAERIDKGEGKTARRAATTIELNAKQLVLLARWLMDKDVEPVALSSKDGQS
jgi:hypothetical protein